MTAANFCRNGRLVVAGTYDGRCVFFNTQDVRSAKRMGRGRKRQQRDNSVFLAASVDYLADRRREIYRYRERDTYTDGDNATERKKVRRKVVCLAAPVVVCNEKIRRESEA